MRKAEIRIRELFDLVIDDYRNNKRKSLPTLAVHIDNHLAPFFDDRSAERLRPSDVEQYKDQRKLEGAKNSTINLELAALRRAFSLGAEKGLVVNRPKIKLYHVGKTNRRMGFFEHGEFEKQVEALPIYAKLILRFGYYTGWREGEIFRLHWTDDGQGSGYYDENGQVVRLYDSKSGHGRVFPLRNRDGSLNEVGRVIEDAKQWRVCRCDLIFHNGKGRAVSRSTFNKHWHKASESSGVNRLFHDLRRTAVRNLTRAGVHRAIAKAITGHETDHVFERYDIVDETDLKQAISKMTSYLTSRNGNGAQAAQTDTQSTEQQPSERSERADERSEEATASGSEQTTDHAQAQQCPSVAESQPVGAESEKLAATSAPTPATRASEADDVFDLMADLGVM